MQQLLLSIPQYTRIIKFTDTKCENMPVYYLFTKFCLVAMKMFPKLESGQDIIFLS